MTSTLQLVLASCFLFVSGMPARACFTASMKTVFVRDTVPMSIPTGAIAAIVEVIAIQRRKPDALTIRTRVLTVLKGGFHETELLLSPEEVTSCDQVPFIGERGVVVGPIASAVGSALTIDPTRFPSSTEQRDRFKDVFR